MSTFSRIFGLAILLALFCSLGRAQGESSEDPGDASVSREFYFPEWDARSTDNYVGVFPVTRLSSYYVYGAGRPAHLLGEIARTPFLFHSGPQYCGWIGLPGLGWFGCGFHPPFPATLPGKETSVLLTDGMSREDVLKSVGLPSKKIIFGKKEIWEYEGYSLHFESNELKDVR